MASDIQSHSLASSYLQPNLFVAKQNYEIYNKEMLVIIYTLEE